MHLMPNANISIVASNIVKNLCFIIHVRQKDKTSKIVYWGIRDFSVWHWLKSGSYRNINHLPTHRRRGHIIIEKPWRYPSYSTQYSRDVGFIQVFIRTIYYIKKPSKPLGINALSVELVTIINIAYVGR